MADFSFLEHGNKKFEEINKYLGNALSIIDYPDREVEERDEEIEALDRTMRRKETPVACLVGLAGVGKTVIVRSYAKKKYDEGIKVVVLNVNIGALNSGGVHNLKERMEMLLPKAKDYEDELRQYDDNVRVILFIDEVHRIISVFGKGSKEGGDILKPTLADAGKYVRVITATTRSEYDTYIAKDGALARRLHLIQIKEVSSKTTKKILKSWLTKYGGKSLCESVDDSVFDRIISANKQLSSEFAEPAKSIDILEDMLSVNEKDKRKLDRELVDYVFRTSKNTDLEMNIDTKNVVRVLRRRVRGQPLVLYTAERMMNIVAWEAKSNKISNRPRSTALLVGTSGVGKTEFVKAINEGLNGNDQEVEIFSMTNYDTEGSSEKFRVDFGKRVRHNKSGVFLFDEIEKAHDNVKLALLPILDEGIVEYHEEGADGYMVHQEVSLRGCMVFATSNAGSKIFEEINRYARELQDIKADEIDNYTDKLKFNTRTIEPVIQQALEKEFPPELLQRFTHTIPFNALNNSTKLDIANKMLAEEIQTFIDEGYTILFNEKRTWGNGYQDYEANEISMYIVIERLSEVNAGASGARNIRKIIKTEVVAEILEAIAKFPTLKRFKLTTNGRCRFQTRDDAISQGAIQVLPN